MNILRSPYFVPGIHAFIWVLLLAIPHILVGNSNFLGLSKNFFLVTSIYHIGLFYLNAYYLYPKLLNRKWWWLYIIVIAAIIIGSFRVKVYLLQLDPNFRLTDANSRAIFFSLIPLLLASMLFRLISDRLRFERLEKEARTEQLAAELKFLRSQVSPHFLFNMMTNMVSLARQRSPLLEPSLIRLSELLRYMLYDSNSDKITVDREIEHLQHYITLQQLRFSDEVEVQTEIFNECETCSIEPMLLVPFIENAFKHSIGLQKDPFIHVRLQVKEQLLDFSVKNNYTKENNSRDKSSGIGLMNVKNRLQLLYPGKYLLDIEDEDGIFSVHLKLDLS